MTAPSSQTFRTELWAAGGKNVAIVVPADVVAAFERGKRVPVVVTIDGGHRYRNTIASMGGRFLISFNAATRAATGRGAGDEVEVRLDVDDAPRTVEVPAELADGARRRSGGQGGLGRAELQPPARARRVDHRRQERGDPCQAGGQGGSRPPLRGAEEKSGVLAVKAVVRCARPRTHSTNWGSSAPSSERWASSPIGTRWETTPAAV